MWLNNLLWAGLVIAVAWLTLVTIRRWRARRRRHLADDDPRAPVLYLRAFAADDDPSGDLPFDDFLSLGVWDQLGPVICAENTRRRLHARHAATMRLDDASWQKQVAALLMRAGCVLIEPGASEGLIWELAQLRPLRSPWSVLVVCRPGQPPEAGAWDDFARQARRQGLTVPAAPPGPGAVLAFDEQWKATPIAEGLHTSEAYADAIVRHLASARLERQLPPPAGSHLDDMRHARRRATAMVARGDYEAAVRIMAPAIGAIADASSRQGASTVAIQGLDLALTGLPDEKVGEPLARLWRQAREDMRLTVTVATEMSGRRHPALAEALEGTLRDVGEPLSRTVVALKLAGEGQLESLVPAIAAMLANGGQLFKIRFRSATALGRIDAPDGLDAMARVAVVSAMDMNVLAACLKGLVTARSEHAGECLRQVRSQVRTAAEAWALADHAVRVHEAMRGLDLEPHLRAMTFMHSTDELAAALRGHGPYHAMMTAASRSAGMSTPLMSLVMRCMTAQVLAAGGHPEGLAEARRLVRDARVPERLRVSLEAVLARRAEQAGA